MNSSILKAPHNCYLILTTKCNMRCRHCYGNYGVDVIENELSGNEWLDIINKLDNNNIFYVNISGGEPTQHPDFCMILEELAKHNVYFMLTTNGVFNRNVLNTILSVKDYLLGVQISLDGPDADSHSYLRLDVNGKENKTFFDITKKTIEELINNDVRVSIATCLHQRNIEKITDMKEYICRIRPKHWSLSTISISGRATMDKKIFISESVYPIEYWTNLKKSCEDKGILVEFVDMPTLVKQEKGSQLYYECPAAKWFCEIFSDGTVSPCPLIRSVNNGYFNFENICEKDIKEIWHGEEFNKFRRLQDQGCNGCRLKDKCNRCIPQSIQWFDNPLYPPPYCIAIGEEIGLKELPELQQRLRESVRKNNREKYIDN